MTLLTWRDVAARLQVGEKQARQVMRECPVIKVGHSHRITEKALAAWVRGRERIIIQPAETAPAAPKRPKERGYSGPLSWKQEKAPRVTSTGARGQGKMTNLAPRS